MKVDELLAKIRQSDTVIEHIGRFDGNLFGAVKDATIKNDEALLQIDASHAGVITRNGMFYSPKKMRDGVKSFTKPYNIPILVNHDMEATPFGRVVDAEYVDFTKIYRDDNLTSLVSNCLKMRKDDAHNKAATELFNLLDQKGFLADFGNKYSGLGAARIYMKITDYSAIEKIKDGRFDTMSVSFSRGNLWCMDCGAYAMGEDCEHGPWDDNVLMPDKHNYFEVSFVNAPADVLAKISNQPDYPNLAYMAASDSAKHLMGGIERQTLVLSSKTTLSTEQSADVTVTSTEEIKDTQEVTDTTEDAVPGMKKYSLASRDHKWSKTEALGRVRAKLDSTDAPSAKYKDAFMWYDSEKEDSFGSYKLPYVDVIDDELKVVPAAIFAIAAAVSGARGGLKNVSEEDKTAIKAHVSSWYKKMAKEFDDKELVAPWDQEDQVVANENLLKIVDELGLEIESDEVEEQPTQEAQDATETAPAAEDTTPAQDSTVVEPTEEKPMLLDILSKDSYIAAVNLYIDSMSEEEKAKAESLRLTTELSDTAQFCGPNESFIVVDEGHIAIAQALLDSHDGPMKEKIAKKLSDKKAEFEAAKAAATTQEPQVEDTAATDTTSTEVVFDMAALDKLSKEDKQKIFDSLFELCSDSNKSIKSMKQEIVMLKFDVDAFIDTTTQVEDKFGDLLAKVKPLIVDTIVSEEIALGKVEKTDSDAKKSEYTSLDSAQLLEKFDFYSKMQDNNSVESDTTGVSGNDIQQDNVVNSQVEEPKPVAQPKNNKSKNLAVKDLEVEKQLAQVARDWKD